MKLALFSMAYRSGMGRVVSALATASAKLGDTVLIAPMLDEEPAGVPRSLFPRPQRGRGKIGKIVSLLTYNIRACWAVWKSVDRRSILVMIDLFSTVPLSILPVFAARLRGARTVLNLHDFYPHSLRYPRALQWLEKWFFRTAYRRFDLIATMTHSQVIRLVQEAAVPAHRVVEVSHGAFPIQGITHPQSSEPDRFLVMGSIRRNKHTLTSIKALTRVATFQEIVVRVAGAPRPEEREYFEACEARLRAFGRAEVSAFFIPDEDLPGILSGVSAILCPYENFDSASGVSVVAVTNRIPLIATSCAVPEALRGIKDAWYPIAMPVTTDAITEAIGGFLALDLSARQTMAEKANRAFTAQDHWLDAIISIRDAPHQVT